MNSTAFEGAMIAQVVAENGVPFTMRLSTEPGELADKYGPIVEFYDSRYSHGGYTQFGQMVSSYYTGTLLDGRNGEGIYLHGGVPEWTLDAATFDLAKTIIRHWLKGLDK